MFDVVVIGGGPAGAQAARRLSEDGHSVLLLDAADHLGDKLCTGIVSKECATEFGLPAEFIWHEGKSLTLHGPDGAQISIRRTGTQALVIDRAAWVRSIAAQAGNNGAVIRLGSRVLDLNIERDKVTVDVKSSEGATRLQARAAIVAGGFRTSLARKVGLDVPEASRFAAQLTVSDIDLTETQVFLRRWIPSSFFGWLVPIGNRGAYLGLLGRGQPQEPFWSLVSGLRIQGYEFNLTERPKIWGVPVRASRKTYTDRCLLVGDAAGQTKPATGGGIFYSLKAGELAAETLSGALRSNDLSSKRLSRYQNAWKKEIGREIRLGWIAREALENMSDITLIQILRAAEGCGLLNEKLSYDGHAEIVMRVLKSGILPSLISAAPALVASLRGDPR